MPQAEKVLALFGAEAFISPKYTHSNTDLTCAEKWELPKQLLRAQRKQNKESSTINSAQKGIV